ncbi:MAG TPA: hypothetical protein VGZ47_19920 [Gemmataceae bacterium]|nr:hypothetical protein [Gemmataceae bacterium]
MPLTRREAEICNKPLRTEAGAMPIWNHRQEKIDEYATFNEDEKTIRDWSARLATCDEMSSAVSHNRNATSAWEANRP